MKYSFGDIAACKNNKYYMIIHPIKNKNILVCPTSKQSLNKNRPDSNLIKQIKNSINWEIINSTDIINKAEVIPADIKDTLLRSVVFSYVKEHYNVIHKNKEKGKLIKYSGRVYNEKEIINLVDSAMDFWLTSGRYEKKFLLKFKKFLNIKYALTTNSGSSANLLAISALTSYKLKKRRLQPGDEVITTAAGFPTTITPIIQNNLVPVFIDIKKETCNINVDDIEKAITKKTKAVFLAHTLGFPFAITKIKSLCKKYNLWLIEDNCDALGTKYFNKYTGTFGHITTFSFYPAHHITMGEGGAVATDDPDLYRVLLSFRDWGRDCWCDPGKDNTCKKRFTQKFGKLPFGYDHKYVYSHPGYNLKITDMQASIAVEQMNKISSFIKTRKNNWDSYHKFFKDYQKYFILTKVLNRASISPFGYILTIKEGSPFSREELINHLENNNIQTRVLFAGNILKQPLFTENNIKIRINDSPLLLSSKLKERCLALLPDTNYIMNNTFWIGVWPGLTKNNIKYITTVFKNFLKKYS